jgi:hypothetical protein
MPYVIDDDCEDQALCPTDHCTICRPQFDPEGKPIYVPLTLRGRFWCCSKCGVSYGVAPHPNCRPEVASADAFGS